NWRGCLGRRNGPSADLEPEEPGEVDAGAGTQALPSPDSRIDVEQERSPRLTVDLVLELDEAAEIRGFDQANRGLRQARVLDRLDERARPAEINRVLTRAAGHERTDHTARVHERGVRELGVTASWNQLLDHHELRGQQRGRLVVETQQRLPVVDAPSLGEREPVQLRLDRRLEDHRVGRL